MKKYFEEIGRNRALYYSWKNREDLKDRKTGPKNAWWAVTKETVENVISIFNNFREIASDYVVGIKAGISPTTAGKILKENGLKPMPEEKEAARILKTYEWLKKNVCWSVDSIKLLSEEGWILIQLLVEEYSRCILGYAAGHLNTADKAVHLVNETIDKLRIKPLVVKFDRGCEFITEQMEVFLSEKEIASMPSPKHYPLFNGKEERINLTFKKFFPKKRIISVKEICEKADKAICVMNHDLPRKIFNGNTSAVMYEKAENYRKEDEIELFRLIGEAKKEMELIKNPRWDKFDVIRKSVVKSVVDARLCFITPEDEMATNF